MIIRKALASLVFIGILCRVQADGERWSRQTSNSEWIPLANPRSSPRNPSPVAAAAAAPPSTFDSSSQAAGQVPAVSLPPALQQQYQEQLLQLQKTQESIQRLLLLQQQLKAQQQILQSQAYQPNGFANPDDEKQALHQSTIVNLQTLPELAPEVLVPPAPSSEALPPVFRAQNFHPPESKVKHGQHSAPSSPTSSEQDYRQIHEESITRGTSHPRENVEKDYRLRQKSRYEGGQRHKEPSHVNFVTPATSSIQDDSDEQEEIQLVYVPAETLAQRGQTKLHKSSPRKHHPNRHHQHHSELPSTTIPPHDAYAREILHQLQRQHEEKNQFLNSERQKEIARLHAEQKELERQARLHQEAVRKEQELLRQREAEKKRKELEKIEEASRQRELQRIQAIREKEREDERRLAELKAKEEEIRQRELEKFSSYEKDKDYRRQKEYEHSKEHDSSIAPETAQSQEVSSHSYEIDQPNAQPLVRESQLHHQHLTEVTNKNNKVSRPRSKPRSKLHQYHQQHHEEYQEPVEPTTPSPNQPPLSVYMGNSLPNHHRIQLSDVLKTLKNARSIAVVDSFGADTPRVFVGPRNLDPPPGYAKFDLPYLSSIENNRVERKVDKLPFFVAPLSFDPPPGYSKIPFPAPHIGSVIINSLENVESRIHENHSPSPLIEPNSYVSQSVPNYDISTPVSYSQESNTPRYEGSSLPSSQPSTKWRFKEFFDSKPSTEIPSAVTAASYHEERTPTSKYEHLSKTRNYYNSNEVPTTPSYFSPKTVTAFSFEQTVPQSTPLYPEEPVRHHHVESHRIDPNNAPHRQGSHYRESESNEDSNQRYPVDPTGRTVTNTYFLNPSPSYDEQTQYNLPAELPAISPQLPGLVNALVEKTELPSSIHLPTTTPVTTTTTTTTTTETPTTTYRPRSRQRGRVTGSRVATTTLSPPARGNTERTRRPSHRSRSKYTTTTEDYRDSSYDPTRRSSVTTTRYDDQPSHVKRPTVRSQIYKYRDGDAKESIQSQIVDSNASGEQGQSDNAYENSPLIDPNSSSSVSLRGRITPTTDLNIPVYQQDDYSASTPSSIDNFSQRDASVADSLLPLSGLDYPRKSTASSYESSSIDDQPVNGFNYRTHESSQSSETTRDFPYFRPGKTDSVFFDSIPTTDSPNVQRSQLQDFSPVYHSVPAQGQYVKNETPRPVYRESSSSSSSEEEQPIFLPIPQDKQEEYSYQTTVTEPLPEITTTTTTTTTEAPVIIRQRVRARLGGRPSQQQQDSTIQTRPRGSQDEYVRFSAVNQDSVRGNSRQRARPRTRTQTNSPIQTDGQEYVRIQGQQRRASTSATTPSTSRTTEDKASAEDDDYGFIRTPNFKAQPQTNYKIVQTTELPDTTTTESNQSQAQLLKTRQKYYSATRRPTTRATTTPRSRDDAGKNRGRVRRPTTRRRVATTSTTTTESHLEANNELPLDENYPRIQAQETSDTQSDLYNEKNQGLYEQTPVRSSSRRGQDITDENYPQEFLLNYGATQSFHREDYDQGERRQPSRPRNRGSSDIYGAESQWSTKLTGNSFQPSGGYSSNLPTDDNEKSIENDKAGSPPEIITVGPDFPAVTVRVSADLREPNSSSEETMMGSMVEKMSDFGKKMNAQEESDNLTTTLPTEGQTQVVTENTPVTEVSTKGAATFKKAGLRRRRVRVRVRPTGSEDFVTAESQSYDSSLNQLPREPTKFRNFYVTTQSATTIASGTPTTTTTETPKTDKSMFEVLLGKVLGNEETATTITDVITTTQESSTIIPSEEVTTTKTDASTVKYEEEGNTELPSTSTTLIDDKTSTQKTVDVKSNSGENAIQSLNAENSLRYFATKSPAFTEYLRNQEKTEKDNSDYPKNHRSKWSEVRYPSDKSLQEFAKWNKNQSGETGRADEKPTGNTDSVTDYVQAIFESIKSADEEHHQNAKIADQKNQGKTETSSSYPTEVKTSVSSSSRIVTSRSDADTTTTAEPVTFGPFVPSMMSDKQLASAKKTPLETNLGKILRTSTTTKVSHMTEICYRGRCVMSKPKKDGASR